MGLLIKEMYVLSKFRKFSNVLTLESHLYGIWCYQIFRTEFSLALSQSVKLLQIAWTGISTIMLSSCILYFVS